MQKDEDLRRLEERIRQGGAEKYHKAAAEAGKLFVRERLRLLLDPDSFQAEDGLLANALVQDLPADGVVTGLGRVGGRTVAFMANDSTVKAGSWGARTGEDPPHSGDGGQAGGPHALPGGLGRRPHYGSD